MVVGVFRARIIGFLHYGSLLFLFRGTLIHGFIMGFMMVIVLDLGMMSSVGSLC